MRAAVEMEELAETRARLPAAAMAAAGAPLTHEAGLLERQPDKAVREGHVVIAPE